ncbi:MAG TPA: pitrilysin family protein [Xanthobacteraceae bacterium]|nr:pitrilysin family protein [Xanthobacteraceae bacterium]
MTAIFKTSTRALLILSVSLSVLSAAALSAGAARGGGPEVAHFTLANGLEMVVVPDHRTPVVTHMTWYRVGSADETPGKSGLAHFLEHLMFKGTAKNPEGKFSQTVATLGGQENAFTTADYTGYFQRIAREHLETMMQFEADRMTGLVLSDDNVRPELKVVLEEWNMRVGNSPDARLGEQVAASLYLNHPYGRPVIGWRHEIETLDREDALAFYRRFYTPNNAVVVIAGDVTAEEVKALAEKTFAKVPRVADTAPRLRAQEPPPAAPRTVMLADPRVAQPSLQRSYLVPSYATSKKDAEALEVLSHILGSGSTSRLYRALVVDQRVATNTGAYYQGSSLDASRFGVYAVPQPGVTFKTAETALDEVIADIVKSGVTAEELERAKTRMIADAVYAQDNQAALARWYGVALTTGSTVEDVLAWPDRIRAVTADAVRDAARTWLDRRRSVTGYLVKELPEEKRS